MTTTASPSPSPALAAPTEGRPHALFYMVLAFLTLGAHVALGARFGIPGFIWFIAMTIIFLTVKWELAFMLMVVSLFLQNAFIALVAPSIVNEDTYMLLQATSFISVVLTAIYSFPFWFSQRYNLPEENRALLRWLSLFFALTGIYTLIGLFTAPFSNVAIYARLYLTGGLLLGIGIAFGLRMPEGYVARVIRLLAVILVGWGLAEFFLTYKLYSLFNVADYMRLKFAHNSYDLIFDSITDAVNFSSRSYLNLSGMMGLDLQLVRLNGPSLHPITYGYCLIFCSLACLIYRMRFLAIACAILAVLVGAKGPIAIVILTPLLYLFYMRTQNPRWLFALLAFVLAAYAAIGLAYGLWTSDFHVIGFMGGLTGFMHNPFGHGIGAGGTLANLQKTTNLVDLQDFQRNGADFGFESAIGVVIYQIGFCIGLFFLFYNAVCQSLWYLAVRHADNRRAMIIPLALALIAVNGIFQEEALSPAGWGLWFLLGGLMLAESWTADLRGKAPKAPIANSSPSALFRTYKPEMTKIGF